jgi:hypothetical protein
MLDPIVTSLVPLAERGPWGPGPWMLVFPLLWIVVIVAAVWFFRSRGWARPSSGPSATRSSTAYSPKAASRPRSTELDVRCSPERSDHLRVSTET